MKDHELEELLLDMESDRVERKAALSDPKRIQQAICAFANDLPNHQKPGVVFIGIHDDGQCANLSITDDLLLRLADMRSNGNILPLPMMKVQKKEILGCKLAVVIVEPSYAPPVRYQGRVWIRVGPRRAVASIEEERRLSEKRRAGDLPFDLRLIHTASLNDLDCDLFQRTYLPSALSPEIIEQNQRPLEAQLTSLRFAMQSTDIHPTVMGILVVGQNPTYFLPGAYVQFLRIAGTELGDPIQDQKEIYGPLPRFLRRLDEIFEAHISVALDISGGVVDTQHPDYPIVALQQLARNAVLHRTYEGTHAPVRITWFDDRIEIYNPGGPYGQVTAENFGNPGVTDYRNPHLAEAMKNLGYVQKFGVGISLARREMEKNNNPPPEFTIPPDQNHVLVTLRRRL
ncbi:MAG: putative DNA binding domain-containing protein [Anaerolineae bacterium]|nr:putative DNA binding domain-containing protein [Anaerolineae bacterium]